MTDSSQKPLLAVKDLAVEYEAGGGLPWKRRVSRAIDGVSFEIFSGETLGLVGESGSGKSTTGRAILRLSPAAAGSIDFDGTEVTEMGRHTPLSYRRHVQAIFQDPSSSLNPRHVVGRCVDDTLRTHGVADPTERRSRAMEVFNQVGLSTDHMNRFPAELSGGQQQRVAIARALVLRPKLVVCDEAVSALDLSTQGQIINLLADLQKATGVSYLFIAHDLGIVRHISDRIAVMQRGRLVEVGDAEEVFTHPRHTYTRKLLGATPASKPEGREERRARRAAFRQIHEAETALA
ncbi:ATP-binding cassette domain-containing protein [Microbacterium thalassium]|uniref:ABC-type oligopeptide transport system ATPase subunit n=1 Tax=Microbacterium thalassium TaxID=362649 RepID=A0A7X0FLY6_9MICO|nr:ATP-binding cassette domain-containing protein [Microbacterium thalassium]MBB6389933.1 ABC-type oligopeptide transport system ATPase subunit [Microbacterium thalassium]GLK24620.1 ABC di/oligopeptide transporter ATPase [Microbacterium thalassium]